MITLVFLSSALFLGWSMGANDAANIFGTAVGSRMLKFATAATLASIFIIVGSTFGGGAADTLSKLGSVDVLAGAFGVTLASALTVALMTRFGLPVSSSQAIVGGIIGWNLYSGQKTEMDLVTKIASTWLINPLLAMGFAFVLFFIVRALLNRSKIHLLTRDSTTRLGLIIIGTFGAYNLGANGIVSVIGVFVNSNPFPAIEYGIFHMSAQHVLFFVGGLAIALGVITFSKRVMMTVGSDIYRLSPVGALIVVMSVSIVLFLFSSRSLHDFLVSHHLPALPLVPISSSQASVGSVIGVALAKKGRNINLNSLVKISFGWVSSPLLTIAITFIVLLFLDKMLGIM
ncbi:MAG: inorganic phosphate transporter [Cyclobacteriaceae bacterium]|nr:inorganic phosphate transporter [Cyclobacteriaceae bacterium]